MNSTPPEDSMSAAWQAYQAMQGSKQRHFVYLLHLERKYEHGGSPSATEQARLAELLQEHDAEVKRFREALRELQASDPDAYRRLVARFAAEGGHPASQQSGKSGVK
ncbi:MAG TPA: hypothetical protein VNN09_14125 [Candidatus Competibacteraceae bacterium]|nr:hypothetical protein [Candidatus Competibacteraceae bacterium]